MKNIYNKRGKCPGCPGPGKNNMPNFNYNTSYKYKNENKLFKLI